MPSLHGWNKMHKIARKQHDWVELTKGRDKLKTASSQDCCQCHPKLSQMYETGFNVFFSDMK